MQSQRFAVEFDHRTVVIAVRVPGGRIFPRPRSIERQLRRTARARGRGPGVPQPAAAL